MNRQWLIKSVMVFPTGAFLRKIVKGKGSNMVVGRNTLGNIPKMVAAANGLDASQYTGHSFRRSAATQLADKGASNMALKRAGR